MLYVVVALSIIVSTFFVGRFFAAKTRLVEQAIEAAIARKVSMSPMAIELGHLKEQNCVMRNLLIDMLENEGSVTPPATKTPAEHDRAVKARIRRRREIFGEAVFLLQQSGHPRSKIQDLKING